MELKNFCEGHIDFKRFSVSFSGLYLLVLCLIEDVLVSDFFLFFFWIFLFLYKIFVGSKKIYLYIFVLYIFGFFKITPLLLKVTEVITEHQILPKIAKSSFYVRRS